MIGADDDDWGVSGFWDGLDVDTKGRFSSDGRVIIVEVRVAW